MFQEMEEYEESLIPKERINSKTVDNIMAANLNREIKSSIKHTLELQVSCMKKLEDDILSMKVRPALGDELIEVSA